MMITHPCNLYPLTPHFYIVNLAFTGVYLIFLFLLQNIDCGYSLGGSTVYPQSTIYVSSKNKKNVKKFHKRIIISTAVKNRSIVHGHFIVTLCDLDRHIVIGAFSNLAGSILV